MSPRARQLPARHDRPAIDEAGLEAARHADRLLAAASSAGRTRWIEFLAPLPDRLRDDELADLETAARRARAAYGPRASLRDDFPAELVEPFRDSIDRLLRLLARAAAEGS